VSIRAIALGALNIAAIGAFLAALVPTMAALMWLLAGGVP
jgi:hypothetical protein